MSTKLLSRQATRKKIVIADDDPDLLDLLRFHFARWGYQVHPAASKDEFWRAIYRVNADLVILDLQFGPHDGMDLLAQLAREGFKFPVIVLTAHGSINGAVKAIKLGALDFLTKPADLEDLRQLVKDALRKNADGLGIEAEFDTSDEGRPNVIVGVSSAMNRVLSMIKDIAPTDGKVLIVGESGTGKELVARAIHDRSRRASQSFVPVNVAALATNLAESLVFGHERGAFTGAVQTQKGLCEAAHQGTLFLDEIGEMDLALQPKMLRFLQSNCFRRVGSVQLRRADVRVIAATNRDPHQMVRERRLREDLYYRLNVVPIVVPPLREHPEDVRVLANCFLARARVRYQKPIESFTEPALHALEQYSWPGNVRQLENLVDRLVILTRGEVIDLADLPAHILASDHKPSLFPEPFAERASGPAGLRRIDYIQRDAIIDALQKSNGRVVQAASVLGMGQATLYRKVKRYGIPLPRRRAK